MNDDPIDTLLVDVRAGTQGFSADIEQMRQNLDNSLVDGFARAGTVLEHGLLSAVRRGSLGFDDLKRIALRTMDEIAAQAAQGGAGMPFMSSSMAPGGLGATLGSALGSVFGLPGRATGGPVAPGRGYLVGERGPELFVPTSAGRVESGLSGSGTAPREVRVAIQLAQPKGASAPVALQRSARQVASTVRRALIAG
ncbi:tail tape measure protein [Croceicoccus estronivorus]|uniref:tail tape measure protein n=1 Tax=Croceicoccus estronivorus TaxID=1172626 RepID=UPI00083068E8|nr:tail tape measure protein [Croceicoccus estronivorus]OCC24242.1 tail tape measure protein [Croceicoccus estronivorus]